ATPGAPGAAGVAPGSARVGGEAARAVMIVRAAATPTGARMAAGTPAAGSGGFTVQAYATNDMMRAVMLSKTLQGKGYAAATATKEIGGVTWYVVRVGRYRDRASAKAMEAKLRSEEGLEAASGTAQ